MDIPLVIETPTEIQVTDGKVVTNAPVPTGGPTDWADLNKARQAPAPAPQTLVMPPAPAPLPEATPPAPKPEASVVVPPPVLETPAAPPAPVPTEQPLPAAPPTSVEVPKKFKGPDGEVMMDKFVKSYRELERAQSRGRIPAAGAPPQAQQPGQPLPVAPAAPASDNPAYSDPFVAQIENDVKKHGIGPVMANLFEAASEVGYKRAMGEIVDIREERQNDRMREELSGIVGVDSTVLSPEGYAKLTAVLRDNPHLMQSPTPWTDAYAKLKFTESVRQGNGTVTTPTPRPAAAPLAPASGARSPETPAAQKIDTPEQLDAHLARLTPDQQKEFWARYEKSIGWKGSR